MPTNSSLDRPVIPRGRTNDAVGSPTVVRRAEEAGVIAFHRTATGRDYLTPRQFANLIDFAEKLERSR